MDATVKKSAILCSHIRNPLNNVHRLRQILKNMFHLHYISEERTYSNNTKNNYNDRMIKIFYKCVCSNLNDYEITGIEKEIQTKTVQFEHYDDRVLLVSMNTRTEKANVRCNQSYFDIA